MLQYLHMSVGPRSIAVFSICVYHRLLETLVTAIYKNKTSIFES